jgi:two-component system chemotaxis response regulator CheB
VQLKPDVLVLDVEMPRMDGITFLRKLMRYYPMSVVVCSTLTTEGSKTALEAMDAGAVEVISKPNATYALADMTWDLVESVRRAAAAKRIAAMRTSGVLPFYGSADGVLIAIGASTGGTVAVESIVRRLPATCPPLVVTLHMPAYIVAAYAGRLNSVSELDIREARNGEFLRPGVALVAPGGKHLVVERAGRVYRAHVKDGPLVNGHCPSVDVLFSSVARAAGGAAVGALLTGMGKDGAKGLLQMRSSSGYTMAQDEESCVVFGMPKAAIDIDAANEVVGLARMPERLLSAASAIAAA